MPKWIIKEKSISGYQPANHTGTINRRLISPETVGSTGIEVLLGTIEKNQGALPHAHPGIEQVCYLLSGTADFSTSREEFTQFVADQYEMWGDLIKNADLAPK